MSGMDEWQQSYNELFAAHPERLNPLLKADPIRAADDAACALDGMFRDIFNDQERIELIFTIIRAATRTALLPSTSCGPASGGRT